MLAALIGVAALVAGESSIGGISLGIAARVVLFLAILGLGYLCMLFVILLRQPFVHARLLAEEASTYADQAATLKSEIKVPPIQRERLNRVKHLAGHVERTLNGWRTTKTSDLDEAMKELDDLGGYLAEYPVHGMLMFFLRVANERWLQATGERPVSTEARQQTVRDLMFFLDMVQASCDKTLSGGEPFKTFETVRRLPASPQPPTPDS